MRPVLRIAHPARRGFSLIELLIVVAIILTIAAIAIPNFTRARQQANETAAASALRIMATSQVQYETSFQQGYAAQLSYLGPPPPGTSPSLTGAALIDSILASGLKSGYTYVYAVADFNGDGRPDRFTINANPSTLNVTGRKYFYVDQTNVIRFSLSGPASATDPPIPN
jgi:prepilin-type N-terminal cleavage/methylation domain-containing protein